MYTHICIRVYLLYFEPVNSTGSFLAYGMHRSVFTKWLIIIPGCLLPSQIPSLVSPGTSVSFERSINGEEFSEFDVFDNSVLFYAALNKRRQSCSLIVIHDLFSSERLLIFND